MNIYIICTGNTCRSPMAEAILRSKKIDDVTVRSAGISTIDGIPIAENAKTLIEHADMPYTATSKVVTAENIEWADYIITMTVAHKHALLRLCPDVHDKVYTLKGFKNPQLDSDVQDPYGGDLAVYEQTFKELSTLFDGFERKLTGG